MALPLLRESLDVFVKKSDKVNYTRREGASSNFYGRSNKIELIGSISANNDQEILRAASLTQNC